MIKKIIKIALWTVFALAACFALLKGIDYLINIEISTFNDNGDDGQALCIDNDKNKQKLQITSMKNQFDVSFVKSAKNNCVCPHFPAIAIASSGKHNAWIYLADMTRRPMIYPNMKIIKKLFTEGSQGRREDHAKDDQVTKELEEEFSSPELSWGQAYSFYSFDEDFFSNSGAYLSLIRRSDINPTINHAWAIEVDHVKKTVKCVGGISWGFRMPWYNVRPTIILPSALTQQNWQTDWIVIQKALRNYESI